LCAKLVVANELVGCILRRWRMPKEKFWLSTLDALKNLPAPTQSEQSPGENDPMGSVKCPHCGLINPAIAERCDCGFDFPTKTLKKPYHNLGQASSYTLSRGGHMSLADQVRAKRRRAAKIGLLAGILIPLVGFWIYFRMTRADKYAIWLRRFHRSEPTRLRFNMLLNRACPGLCVPVTVQDSVFKTSYYSSASRMLLFYPIAIILGVLDLLLAQRMSDVLANLGVGIRLAGYLGQVVAVVPLGLLLWYAVKKQMVRRGYVALTPDNAIEEVDVTLEKITQRKLGFRGVMVFKCPDEVWHQVVSLGISRASAVIIDVSDLTENVLWELRTSLEKHRPESVLLTFGVPKDAREELPRTARAELEKVVSSDSLSRLRVFYYPAEQPPLGPSRGRLYTNLSKRLSTELAACMEDASA